MSWSFVCRCCGSGAVGGCALCPPAVLCPCCAVVPCGWWVSLLWLVCRRLLCRLARVPRVVCLCAVRCRVCVSAVCVPLPRVCVPCICAPLCSAVAWVCAVPVCPAVPLVGAVLYQRAKSACCGGCVYMGDMCARCAVCALRVGAFSAAFWCAFRVLFGCFSGNFGRILGEFWGNFWAVSWQNANGVMRITFFPLTSAMRPSMLEVSSQSKGR